VTKLVEFYGSLLGPAATLTTFVLGLICLDFLGRRTPAGDPSAPSKNEERRFQSHEKVALVGFLTIPCFSYLAARLSGAPMMDRYSLATVAGIAAVLGVAAGKRAITGLFVLTVLSALLARQFMNFVHAVDIKEPAGGLMISTTPGIFNQRYYFMSSGEDKELPIVLLDTWEWAATFFYAPAEIAPRLVYLAEEGNFNANAYRRLQNCCRAAGKLATLDEILATTNTFLVYSPSSSFSGINRFTATGGTISVKTITADYALFQVTYPSR
jgi:hypothetical protein